MATSVRDGHVHKVMSMREFYESGLLQEINRYFTQPTLKDPCK